MTDRYNILSQMEHLQSKYMGTGHADATKFEWATHQHRFILLPILVIFLSPEPGLHIRNRIYVWKLDPDPLFYSEKLDPDPHSSQN
jgi:hypothetical protein